MSERKKKNEPPENLNREEMMEKISQRLNSADFSTVYLTYVFLDCMEDEI